MSETYDREKIENTVDSVGSMIDFLFDLIKKMVRIFSGQWIQDILKSNLKSK